MIAYVQLQAAATIHAGDFVIVKDGIGPLMEAQAINNGKAQCVWTVKTDKGPMTMHAIYPVAALEKVDAVDEGNGPHLRAL